MTAPSHTWVRFSANLRDRSQPQGTLPRARYHVDEVRHVCGRVVALAAKAHIERTESSAPLECGDGEWVGLAQHALYTDATLRSHLRAISAAESRPCAVLIPIAKSAAWWSLAQDERLALMRGDAPARGHFEIGAAFASRIHRRLLHCRYLPGSQWDFLTYFEFPEDHRDAFRTLLGQLRDPERNPEWVYVEHETEIWMTQMDE